MQADARHDSIATVQYSRKNLSVSGERVFAEMCIMIQAKIISMSGIHGGTP